MFKLCVLKIRKKIVIFPKWDKFILPSTQILFWRVTGIWVKVLLKATFYNTGTKKSSFKLVCTVFFPLEMEFIALGLFK